MIILKKKNKPARFTSRSPEETLEMGRRIGRLLKGGDLVALMGDLGSGKTCLVKGIAAGLDVPAAEEKVTSPTFSLVNEYQGREKIYHMDWYRLEKVEGQDAELMRECLDSEAVCLIEWAERGANTLPADRLEVRMRGSRLMRRSIEIVSPTEAYRSLLQNLEVG